VTNVKTITRNLKILSRFMYCKKLQKTLILEVYKQILTVWALMTVGT